MTWVSVFSLEARLNDQVLCQSTAAGLALLGPTDEKFTDVTDIYAPISDGAEDKAFVSKSAPLLGTALLLLSVP